MDAVSLEEIIRRYIQLPPTPAGTGWYPVLCKVCNDHGRKGPRAGFRFDGEKVAYHCFNCGHACVFDAEQHRSLSTKMQQVLNDFGVPENEWQQVLFTALAKRNEGGATQQAAPQSRNIEPVEIPLPDIFYPLADAEDDDKWAEIARYYLLEERGIQPSSYPFLLSKRSDDQRLKKWFGRVIIPIYKDGKLVFYQGRDLTGKAQKKYESPAVTRERVLFGFDKLFDESDISVYIVEGWFDAFVIDGVALLGNEISDIQAEWLNRSRKKKVYIPDRFGDGKRGAERALELGWHISTPDIGGCKDMNQAVKRYGKLYVMKSIVDNTSDGFEAMTKLGVYCR